ncbi:hypothetical protein HDR58_08185 [bacterium]|nr:hypothetical protein [bacterium]
MYIFELIAQAFKPKRKSKNNFNPLEEIDDIIEDSDKCEHLFMPLDSSNEMFACKYCGLIVPKEKLKNINIFAR